MSDPVGILLIIGALFLVFGLIGGLEIKEFKFPQPGPRERVFLITTGTLLLIIGIWRLPSGPGTSPAPTATLIAVVPTATPVAETPMVVPSQPAQTATLETTPTMAPSITPTVEPPTSTLTPTTVPQGMLPTIAPLAEDAIGIYVQVDLSGTGALRGKDILQSIQLAVEVEQQRLDFAARGLKVQVIPVDDHGVDDFGFPLAQQVASIDQAVCALGLNRSSVALEALKAYDKNGMFSVSVGATNLKLSDAALYPNRVFYRMVGTDDQQGQRSARYIRDVLRRQRVKLFYMQGNDYSEGIATAFKAEAEQLGLEIIGGNPEIYVNAAVAAASVKATNPDLVFFAGYYDTAGRVFEQIFADPASQKLIFFGPDGIDSPEMAQLTPKLVQSGQLYYSTVAAPVTRYPKAAPFAQAYQLAYNTSAPPFFAESFDAARFCLEMIVKAAVATNDTTPSQQAVLDQAHAFKGAKLVGISGDYTFDANGNPESAGYFVRRANAATWSDNEVVFPPR